jgi:hypothetical protein
MKRYSLTTYQSHSKLSLNKRVFFDEPAAPENVVPRAGFVHPCPPKLKEEWWKPPQR